MKRIKLVAMGLSLAIGLTACSNSGSGVRNSNQTILKIGEEEISNKDYYKMYDLYKSVIALNNGLDNTVTSMMVRDKFISDDLKANKIEITDEEYQVEIDKAIEQMGGKDAYAKYIDFMDTTEEVFEANIKNNYNNTKHLEWYSENHKASDEEVENYYNQYKDSLDYVTAKHILVEDEAKAKEIVDKLNDGEDFSKLNEEYSIDEAAKARGGELGQVQKGKMDEDFVNAAFALDVDEISQAVKTQFGYHIIQVSEKKVGLEAHKDQIIQNLASQAHNKYVDEGSAKLDVKMFDQDGNELNSQADPSVQENTETNEKEGQ